MRINAPGSAWHEDDVAMVAGRSAVVMVPNLPRRPGHDVVRRGGRRAGAYDRGADAWSLPQQIVHYAGDRWRMDQLAWALFHALVETVMNCESSAPGAHVGITTAESNCENFRRCSQFAATIDVPLNQVIAHVYLSSVGSSVTDLSLWSSPTTSGTWSAPSDAVIFAAANRRLYAAWPCG